MSAIRQIIRGCRSLPHVGKHPGTNFLVLLIMMGAAAGRDGGWRGCIGGALIMATVFVPAYLYGAYSRSNSSDQYSEELSTPAPTGEKE